MSADRLALASHWLDVGQPRRTLEALGDAGDEAAGPEGLRLRALAHLDLDEDGEALHAAQRALALEPDDTWTLAIVADARCRLGDLPGAETALLAALGIEPTSVPLLADYARVLAKAGQADKAGRVLERAAQLDPSHPVVARARSYLALARGDDKAARMHARGALALDASDSGGHVLYGMSSALTGRVSDADRHLSRYALSSLGDADARELAIEARIAAHPLLYPLRIIGRTSPGVVWLAGVALLLASRQLASESVQVAVVLTWLSFVLWSWIGPPLVGAWVKRRSGW